MLMAFMPILILTSCIGCSDSSKNEVTTDSISSVKEFCSNPNLNGESKPNNNYEQVRARQLKGYIFYEVNSDGDSIFFYDKVFNDSVMEERRRGDEEYSIIRKIECYKVVHVMIIRPKNPEQYYTECQYFVNAGKVMGNETIYKSKDGSIYDTDACRSSKYESPFPNSLGEDILMWAETAGSHGVLNGSQREQNDTINIEKK